MFRIGCPKVCSAWNKLLAKMMNAVWPIYCKVIPIRRDFTKKTRQKKVIVSLTSFPARFNTLHLCIQSILRQSYTPDLVVLWLVKEECEGMQLPEELLELKKYGLEIKYSDINLRPHNKFIFSAQEFSDSIIITMDDDVIYSSDTIEKLIKGYEEHTDCVICNMAHKITLNEQLMPNPYSKWVGGAIGEVGPSNLLTALGVGGVLYPPNTFDKQYFDYEVIRENCLTADDLWLKYNELRLGYRVFKVKAYAKHPVTISRTQSIALTKLNNGHSINDLTIEKLNRLYPINWKEYEEECKHT